MDLSSLRKVPIQNSVPLATVSPPDPTQRGPGLMKGADNAQQPVADRQSLHELLGEFLAIDQAVAEVYTAVIARISDSAIRNQLQEYLSHNVRQQDLLDNVIRTLGGTVAQPGTRAQLAKARLERMFQSSVAADPQAQLEADLRVLVLMETERRDNWLFLEELGPAVGDDTAAALIAGRSGDLNIEQELHVEWILGVLNALRMRRLSLPAPGIA